MRMGPLQGLKMSPAEAVEIISLVEILSSLWFFSGWYSAGACRAVWLNRFTFTESQASALLLLHSSQELRGGKILVGHWHSHTTRSGYYTISPHLQHNTHTTTTTGLTVTPSTTNLSSRVNIETVTSWDPPPPPPASWQMENLEILDLLELYLEIGVELLTNSCRLETDTAIVNW